MSVLQVDLADVRHLVTATGSYSGIGFTVRWWQRFSSCVVGWRLGGEDLGFQHFGGSDGNQVIQLSLGSTDPAARTAFLSWLMSSVLLLYDSFSLEW